jgi:hypothetical protein
MQLFRVFVVITKHKEQLKIMTEFDRTERRERVRRGALLSAVVAAVVLTGCSHDTQRNCVDQNGVVLPDSACRSTYVGSGGYYRYPHWVYGGSRSGPYMRGYSATAPSSGRVVTPSGSVVRGGFGFFGGGGHGFGGGS